LTNSVVLKALEIIETSLKGTEDFVDTLSLLSDAALESILEKIGVQHIKAWHADR